MKWNESGFRPPLCTYRLNWARRTSWEWWDDWDDTVLQTQDSKFEPWRSEAEHATSRSRRLPTILTFTRGSGEKHFLFLLNRRDRESNPELWRERPPPFSIWNHHKCLSWLSRFNRIPMLSVGYGSTTMINISFFSVREPSLYVRIWRGPNKDGPHAERVYTVIQHQHNIEWQGLDVGKNLHEKNSRDHLDIFLNWCSQIIIVPKSWANSLADTKARQGPIISLLIVWKVDAANDVKPCISNKCWYLII